MKTLIGGANSCKILLGPKATMMTTTGFLDTTFVERAQRSRFAFDRSCDDEDEYEGSEESSQQEHELLPPQPLTSIGMERRKSPYRKQELNQQIPT